MHILRLAILCSSIALIGAACTRRGGEGSSPLPSGGMYRSDDGGYAFEQKANFVSGGGITNVTPQEVLIDPFNASTLYMAAAGFGLLRTSNAGETWEQIKEPAATVTSVTVHPHNPNILYIAGTSEGATDRSKVWKTYDRGETWQELYAEAFGTAKIDRGIFQQRRRVAPAVMTVVIDPTRPEVIYAGSSSGALIVSTDGGGTWSTRRSFTQGVSGLKLSPNAPGRLFVRLADGSLARSDDGGTTASLLTIRDTGARAGAVLAVYLPPASGTEDTVLVGTDAGLFRTRDRGETWERVPLPVSAQQHVPVTTVTESSDGTLWAGSNVNLYASADGGTTWRVQQFPFANRVRFLLADPKDPQRLYAFVLPAT